MRVIVYILLAIAAVTTVISLTGPNIDLAVASLFYEPANRLFVGLHNPLIAGLREHGLIAVTSSIAVVALGLTRLLPWKLPSFPPRATLALALAMIIGPGILVNVILKPHGGRPRPIEVTQFGGPLQFVDWWNPTGACDGNCSFMSGEATTAAWMFGPAMLAAPQWRAVAIGAAALFTFVISAARVMAGGHFFSDVLIGALTTILILLAMFRLCGVPR